MQNPDVFEERYKKLNAEQKKAVDLIDGPVMVIAGPGTGKTEILTLRIANILRKTDLPANAILALTFTESGAATMRRRLADIVGEAAYRVRITTFHGFANDVIQYHPEHFPELAGTKPISETDRVRLIESLITELPLKLLRPFGDLLYYLRPVLGKLDTVKREGWTPATFKKLATEKLATSKAREDRIHAKGAHAGKVKGEVQDEELGLERLIEFASIYSAYQGALTKKRVYDFTDMILKLQGALEERGELLQVLQEQNQYVLVDEHQDTNWVQNRVLELLLDFHPSPNLFIVGDEKQAIYRFQGASLDNFRYFEEKFKGTELVTLKENYRSTQEILDAAHGIAKTITERAPELSGNLNEKGEKVVLREFTDSALETSWIAEDIKERIEGGEKGGEVAVLYRNNHDGFEVGDALRARGVPHRIESEENVLEDRSVRRLLIHLEAAVEFGNPERLVRALHAAFRSFDALDVYKVISTRRTGEVVRSVEALREVGVSNPLNFSKWAYSLSGWEALAKTHGLPEALAVAFRESGFIGELLTKVDPEAELAKARVLFDAAKELTATNPTATLRTFLEHIEILRANGFELETKAPSGIAPGKVRLMTVHRAKGQEFGTVYVYRSIDSRWGGRKKPDPLKLPPEVWRSEADHDPIDDERRLFYVALTRAKRTAIVTYSTVDQAGREVLPTRFVGEIKPELIERKDTKDFETTNRTLPDFAREPVPETREGEAEFVKRLFEARAFSVTHLNNYLACPWRYFYANLLRIPEVETRHQAYGTAVHGALRRFFELLRKGGGSGELLVQFFREELERTKIAEQDKQDALRRGEEALLGWYEANHITWPQEALVEHAVSGVAHLGVQLTGKIDKIEYLPSGGVRVIDYKTSKPKTRNELLGNTKNADGNYLRQLAFYKLLLDRSEGGKYRVEEGMIDFVQPDAKDKYHSETFKLDEIPYEKTLTELEKTIEEVRNFAFRDRFCDDPECEYCELRKMVS